MPYSYLLRAYHSQQRAMLRLCQRHLHPRNPLYYRSHRLPQPRVHRRHPPSRALATNNRKLMCVTQGSMAQAASFAPPMTDAMCCWEALQVAVEAASARAACSRGQPLIPSEALNAPSKDWGC